jgi:hypothetical protein
LIRNLRSGRPAVWVDEVYEVNSQWSLAARSRTRLIDMIAVASAFVVAGAVIAATPADGSAAEESASAASSAGAARVMLEPAVADAAAPDRKSLVLPSGETAMFVVGCVLVGLGAVLRQRDGSSGTGSAGPVRTVERTAAASRGAGAGGVRRGGSRGSRDAR